MARLSSCAALGLFLAAFVPGRLPAASPSDGVVLVEFRSPACGPCRAMQPIVDRLAAEGYDVRQVDVSRDPGAAARYGVESWPTFVAVRQGREVGRIVGATGRENLLQLLARGDQLAATPLGRGASAPVSRVGLADQGSQRSASTFADQPAPGRMVQIEEPPLPALGRVTERTAAVGGVDRLLATTVRLQVDDAEGESTGTGVIVDARQGAALVLTCGHIFRSSQGRGAVKITLFAPSPQGPTEAGVVDGQLLHYDLKRDLGLVMIRPGGAVASSPVGAPGTRLAPGEPVTAIGCNHGADPQPWATRITAVNRYQGTPNVEAAGAPVEGRSGGPLFNAAGAVVGICFAADPKENEGLYASLAAIHAELDEAGLSTIYQSPAGAAAVASAPAAAAPAPAAPAAQLASLTVPRTIRGQDPQAGLTPTPTPPSAVASGAAPDLDLVPKMGPVPSPPLSLAERATLEELTRQPADAEVICIIRPRSGGSEVIKLNAGSPALVAALRAASEASTQFEASPNGDPR